MQLTSLLSRFPLIIIRYELPDPTQNTGNKYDGRAFQKGLNQHTDLTKYNLWHGFGNLGFGRQINLILKQQ